MDASAVNERGEERAEFSDIDNNLGVRRIPKT